MKSWLKSVVMFIRVFEILKGSLPNGCLMSVLSQAIVER